MADDRELRWGILGCGEVTEKKSGPGFQMATRSILSRVMRRNGELAADYARRHGVPHWTDDVHALIGAEDVDAVCIATPPDSHAALARQVAEAGKPVLVEKPLANRLDDAEGLVTTCERLGVPLFCSFYRRAMPRFRELHALLRSGEIGEIERVEIVHHLPGPDRPYAEADLPWRLRPGPGDGGIFADMGSHMLNLVQYLVGAVDPGTVRGGARNVAGLYPVVDTVEASFTCLGPDGAVAVSGDWSHAAGDRIDRTTIRGSAGSVSFASFDKSDIVVEGRGGKRAIAAPYPQPVQLPMIQQVTDAILDGGASDVSGAAGLATARLQDRILSG